MFLKTTDQKLATGCVENILWTDLQAFLVETSHIMFLIKKRRSADAQYLLTLWLEVIVYLFYNQPVYLQLALGLQINKQLLGPNLFD